MVLMLKLQRVHNGIQVDGNLIAPLGQLGNSPETGREAGSLEVQLLGIVLG